MDFYEVGVYLVIVIVASTSVFGVMWLLIRSMAPKRPKRKRKIALTGAAARTSLSAGSGAGSKSTKKENKKGKDKKSKVKKDGLLELKELPDSKMLQAGGDQSSKGKETPAKAKPEEEKDRGKESIDVGATAATADAAATAAAVGAGGEAVSQEGGEVTLPDLPSMDTLTEEEQEMPKEEIDLMSVFESEDAEDSATSDLAANLFDVDVSNIEKLGNEVAQFLSGKR